MRYLSSKTSNSYRDYSIGFSHFMVCQSYRDYRVGFSHIVTSESKVSMEIIRDFLSEKKINFKIFSIDPAE